jgi:hypothetical protein
VPPGTFELVKHGVPVDRFPLYTHQEEAVLAAFGDRPNLLVATGTGSGKTEAFLLPILCDILREAQNWEEPSENARRGRYDAQSDVWLDSRRHERRPAAIRAIVLYPMNGLGASLAVLVVGVSALGSFFASLGGLFRTLVAHAQQFHGLRHVFGFPNVAAHNDTFCQRFIRAI